MTGRRAAVFGLVLAAVFLSGCSRSTRGRPDALGTEQETPQPRTVTATPSATGSGSSSGAGERTPKVIGTVATGLETPWGIAFLPDHSALVGERDTTRLLLVKQGTPARAVGRIGGVLPRGEAGLLGLAASPTYAKDHLVFAYLCTASDNRVVKLTYDHGRLGPVQPVLTGIPNGFIHDGGRLLFGPDGNLFVSTGETGDERLAQDPHSLGGKILHITPEGKPAPDNPVKGSPVWTMGHRNVQGLAYDEQGRLWATEFGNHTWDELNLIEKGLNYGWPVEEGRGTKPGYRNPFVQWHTDAASPSGLAYDDGALWAGALHGERLWRIPVEEDNVGTPQDYFVGHYGRLRTVVAAPDGNLWVTTSNRDGRGDPRPGDDRILVVRP